MSGEWFGEWASARYCESLMELLRQRFRIVQSTGIEAFREPIMGRGERVGRTHFVVLVLPHRRAGNERGHPHT